MNRDRMVNQLSKNVPEEIKKCSSVHDKMLMARYLYLEICKNCHYDGEYNISSIDEQRDIFNGKKKKNEKKYNIGICNDFAMIGVDLYKKMGLNAIALDVDGNEYKDGCKIKNPLHIYFMFSVGERDENGNEKFYLADPSFDLKRVQIGCATKYFASKPKTEKNKKGYDGNLAYFSQLTIKEFDKRIGYCKEKYTDEIVRDIIVQNSTLDLDNKSKYEKTILRVEDMLKKLKESVFGMFEQNIGISDRQSAYKMIFHKAFPEEMNKGNIDFNIHKNKKNELISTLTIKNGKNKKEYTYSNGTYEANNIENELS